MEGKTIISIIVPVYNGEMHIRECLNSLIKQTYPWIEIIAVNDGSTDSTGRILEEYAKEDERVVAVNQENRGTGAARNMGIKCAKGEFLTFVDGDDYLTLDCIEKLVDRIKSNSQVSLVNWRNETFGEGKTSVAPMTDEVFETGAEYIQYLLENGGGTGGACCKAYRTSLLQENQIMFGGFKTAEDGHFNAVCLKYLTKVVNMDYVGYMYRKEDYVVHSKTKFFNRPNFFVSSVESGIERLAEFRTAMDIFDLEDKYWKLYYESEFYTFSVINAENSTYNHSLKNKVACNKKLLSGVLSEGSLSVQPNNWRIRWLNKIYKRNSGWQLFVWNYFQKGFIKNKLIYLFCGRLFPKNTKRGLLIRKISGR